MDYDISPTLTDPFSDEAAAEEPTSLANPDGRITDLALGHTHARTPVRKHRELPNKKIGEEVDRESNKLASGDGYPPRLPIHLVLISNLLRKTLYRGWAHLRNCACPQHIERIATGLGHYIDRCRNAPGSNMTPRPVLLRMWNSH